MGADAEGGEGLHDAGGAEQVHLDSGVQWRVERHRGGRVDDDVAEGESGAARVVEGQAIGAHVAADGVDPLSHHVGEAVLAVLGAQPIEGVVAEDLPLGPLLHGGPATRADEQDELAAGHAAQQPLDQGRAEEPRAPGDGDALAVQALRDHRICLPSGRWARRTASR